METRKNGVGGGGGNSALPSNFSPTGTTSTVLVFGEKTTIDIEGWHEKLLRRTKSETTVHAYDGAVKRFEQFVNERMGLTMGQAIERIRSDDASVYEVLDRFVGWANSLQVTVKGSESAIQLMPHTIHRYVEGTKSFLRYHGVEISNEKVKQKVTLPVAEEIADVPLERKVIRTILMSDAPLMFRTGCAIMKDAGTRIGETLQIKVKDIHLDEDPGRREPRNVLHEMIDVCTTTNYYFASRMFPIMAPDVNWRSGVVLAGIAIITSVLGSTFVRRTCQSPPFSASSGDPLRGASLRPLHDCRALAGSSWSHPVTTSVVS